MKFSDGVTICPASMKVVLSSFRVYFVKKEPLQSPRKNLNYELELVKLVRRCGAAFWLVNEASLCFKFA